MYKGNIQTIADKGVSPSETADAIQEMAKEFIGSREAFWHVIHNDRQLMLRRMQCIAFMALGALLLSLFLLVCRLFS